MIHPAISCVSYTLFTIEGYKLAVATSPLLHFKFLPTKAIHTAYTPLYHAHHPFRDCLGIVGCTQSLHDTCTGQSLHSSHVLGAVVGSNQDVLIKALHKICRIYSATSASHQEVFDEIENIGLAARA